MTRRRKARTISKISFTALTLLLLAAAGGFSLWSLSLFRQLELVTHQRSERKPAVYFSDPDLPGGAVALEDLSAADAKESRWVPLDKIPALLQKSVVLLEDRRFFKHHGIDPRGIARAAWINMRRRGLRQGASTLTQQLVKNAFLTHERTWRRKLTEALLAVLMEMRYTKEQILEMYLNQIYLGQNGARGVYGVEEASLAFFNKDISRTTPAEMALLVGIIPAPSANNPRAHPDESLKKRNRILEHLREAGLLSEDQFSEAEAAALSLAPLPETRGAYYLTWVRQLLSEEFGDYLLDTQGYQIYTSMDKNMQAAAEKAIASQPLEGALVALDPKTGLVRALVGGRKFSESPYNRATLARRQPGSAFKPFVLAAALETKAATLATTLDDKPLVLIQDGQKWAPKNYDGLYRGTTTVRDTLVQSLNIPAVHLLEKTGTAPVISLAQRLGIKSPLRPLPSLALGTSEVTPLELTAAYAAFANGGASVAPLFIRRIVDAEGAVLEEYAPSTAAALSAPTAALVTDVLMDVFSTGTARSAKALGFEVPAAGKTGTSDGYRDAWFVGYTPGLVCGVWLGHDLPASLGRSAAALALPVWANFMSAASGPWPWPGFARERDLVKRNIDPVSGLLARAGCPSQKSELFIPGTEPKDFCPLHMGGVKGLFKRFLKFWKD